MVYLSILFYLLERFLILNNYKKSSNIKMSNLFIVRITPNQEKMQANKEEKLKFGKGHHDYIDKLVENEVIKFGGPIEGKLGGMLIVTAETKEKVEDLFGEDPMIKNEYLSIEVNKWTIKHGKLD